MARLKTWNKAVLVPIDQLVFTDWNCNEMSDEMLAELSADIEPDEEGNIRFDEPIQVVPIKSDKGKYLVIGGEHRTKIMMSLNQETIPCVIRKDLAGLSRKDLILWSVRRNNLRGKINEQKYAQLENELINEHDMDVAAARRTMLIDDDIVSALKTELSETPAQEKDIDFSSSNKYDDNDFDSDIDSTSREKSELLAALRMIEQDVLLDSADTVEFGYLFFV